MRDVHAEAPGRVNLIGEHTDYQDGFVLPCAVPQHTAVNLVGRSDRRVRAWSAHIGGEPIEYALGREQRTGGWIDYVQGVTWVLRAAGFALSGADLEIRSDVPVGSGLSSSAALEVAALRALREAFDLELTDLELARLAQRAEVEFVGAPVGIMDPMACSLANTGEALFLDTRTLDFERIRLPGAFDLVVIDSAVKHRHAGGEYVTRRRESEEAARLLGVSCLRDVPPDALTSLRALPPLLARRARHVITENARVLEARSALIAGDPATLGELFTASHASMRDDYEVSSADVDTLVDIAVADPGVFGARMTGGGFGGAVVIAAAAGSGAEVAGRIREAYSRRTHRAGAILLPLGC